MPAAAAVFDVDTYGAVGDGTTDDGPAIRTALAAAIAAAGTNSVTFTGTSTYFIADDPDAWSYFRIENASDLTLLGNGATLMFEEFSYPFMINDSTNVKLEDFTIDYQNLSTVQGTVTAVSAANDTFDFDLAAGFTAPPLTAAVALEHKKYLQSGGQHGQIVNSTTGHRVDRGDGKEYFDIEGAEDLGSGEYRFQLTSNSAVFADNIQVGDEFVQNFPTIRIGHEAQLRKMGWLVDTNASDSGGSLNWTETDENTVTCTFTGTSVKYFARKDSSFGKVTVTLDGDEVLTEYDLYSASPQYQIEVYSVSGLADESHSLKIAMTGEKNASSSGTGVNLDYLEYVDGSTVTVENDSLYLVHFSNHDFKVAGLKVTHSTDIVFEDITIYWSPSKVVRLTANEGDITFRRFDSILKPSSGRFLASGSDGIHAKNNRGAVILEDCVLEAANDDLVNLSTIRHRVTEVYGDDSFQVNGRDANYYDTDIIVGDKLLFENTDGQSYTEVIVLTSSKVANGKYDITIDTNLSWVVVQGYLFNKKTENQYSSITDSTFRPMMRNAMVLRSRYTDVLRNSFEGMGGKGIMSIKGGDEIGRITNLKINDNTFDGMTDRAIELKAPWADYALDFVANIVIKRNTITNQSDMGIYVEGFDGLNMEDNSTTMADDGSSGEPALWLVDGINFDVLNDSIVDPRSTVTEATVVLDGWETAESSYSFLQLDTEEGVTAIMIDGVPVGSGATRYDQDESIFSYTGNWAQKTHSADYQPTASYGVKRSTNIGAKAIITFTADRIVVGARTGSVYGNVDVYVDDVFIQEVDMWSSPGAKQVEVWDSGDLGAGSHTVRWVVNGNKNVNATNRYVTIDFVDLYYNKS